MDKLPIGEPVVQPDDTVLFEVGGAEKLDGDGDERPVAVLWIFDPEQRHWLREYYVKKQSPVKPNGKRMGYQK